MPNLVTHALMATYVKKQVNWPPFNEKAYLMGSTGPDIFYYYHVWPWGSEKECQFGTTLGDCFHQQHINDYLSYWLERAKETQDVLFISYLAGYLMHFMLDVTAHPYIFWKTKDASQARENYRHRCMETRIDALLYPFWQKEQALKPYEIVQLTPTERTQLVPYYQEVAEKYFHIPVSSKVMAQCFMDCYGIQRCLYDPHGWKYALCERIEQAQHHFLDAKSLIMPSSPFLDIHHDLNLERHLWQHPITHERHHDSFIDLFNEAVKNGMTLLKTYRDYIEGKQEREAVMALIGNRNFDTGLEVES